MAALDATNYTVLGEPTTADDAAQLAADDTHQFQLWALDQIGARTTEIKKGPDKGVDGRLFFFDEGQRPKQVIVSVKGGKLKPEFIRELPSIVEREKAQIGVLISLHAPSQAMRSEAASAGYYTALGHRYPRIQLLTIEELLRGKQIEMPAAQPRTRVALPDAPEVEVHPDQMSLG